VVRILFAVGLSLGVAAGFGAGDDDAEEAGGVCEAATIAPTRSCAKGGVEFARSCCPDGYRPHGIAYVDVENGDSAKSIAPVCRPIAGGEDLMPQSPGEAPIVLTCGSVEIFNGVACKDLPDSDTLDGCTAICTQASTKARRYVENPDIDDNDSPLRESATPKYHSRSKSKSRVLGLAYKTLEDSGDQLDCAAISYKSEPIAK
jgi:hypothetical protein